MINSASPSQPAFALSGKESAAQTSPLMPTYNRAPLAFERGEGVYAYTDKGEQYLDFGAGVAVNALGHTHPHLVAALTEQAQKIWHTSNLYRVPQAERLAQRLVDASFADQVFFTNSGAEALETAIKVARKYHATRGQPERYRIITFEGAFHGRTLATLAAGGQMKYIEGFGPKVDGFDQVPFGDHAALKAAITLEVGAILVEPIQGEGGIRSVPPQCLRGLRQLCDEHGLLLILDEVQTGIGRTGKLFAYQHAGMEPDILASAKGLGGGFPIGACLATKQAAQGMIAGSHGSTFGGNPLAAAVGDAVLDVVLQPDFLKHVQDMGLHLKQSLAGLKDQFPDIIEDVRGEGLLLGIKVRPLNTYFVAAARTEKLLLVAAGDNVVRLIPPLIITQEHVREAVQKLENAARLLQKKHS
jgi:acetylornithine/N-succinyldiaminopimelate aminotransferase